MGKLLKPTCKICRRDGVSICGKAKCAFKKRPIMPGAHGPTSRTRLSDYGIQLREKQKAKHVYNILEKQFNNYFKKASMKKGNTGENLVRLLETRLDNTVYRLGFAETRRQARQMVSHGLFAVNGKKLNIPSYLVEIGDIITVKEGKREKKMFEGMSEKLAGKTTPSWLFIDTQKQEGKVTGIPEGEDIKQQIFDTKLIVEFYSR